MTQAPSEIVSAEEVQQDVASVDPSSPGYALLREMDDLTQEPPASAPSADPDPGPEEYREGDPPLSLDDFDVEDPDPPSQPPPRQHPAAQTPTSSPQRPVQAPQAPTHARGQGYPSQGYQGPPEPSQGYQGSPPLTFPPGTQVPDAVLAQFQTLREFASNLERAADQLKSKIDEAIQGMMRAQTAPPPMPPWMAAMMHFASQGAPAQGYYPGQAHAPPQYPSNDPQGYDPPPAPPYPQQAPPQGYPQAQGYRPSQHAPVQRSPEGPSLPPPGAPVLPGAHHHRRPAHQSTGPGHADYMRPPTEE